MDVHILFAQWNIFFFDFKKGNNLADSFIAFLIIFYFVLKSRTEQPAQG